MKMLLSLLVIFSSQLVLAHGSDKPGPHGGFVQMPGAFHTEVVPGSDGSFHIYLIDMEFKNPTVQDSEVQAWLLEGKKKIDLSCEVMGSDHFHCSLKGAAPKKAQTLVVKAKRAQMQGNEAKYKLPLKLSKTNGSHH